MNIPSDEDSDAAFELDQLRDLAKREGFAYATFRALGMAEASICFLSEIVGSASVAHRVSMFLGRGRENTSQLVSLPDHPLPDILALARPPEFWAQRFDEAGIRASARSIREKAVKAGLCGQARVDHAGPDRRAFHLAREATCKEPFTNIGQRSAEPGLPTSPPQAGGSEARPVEGQAKVGHSTPRPFG